MRKLQHEVQARVVQTSVGVGHTGPVASVTAVYAPYSLCNGTLQDEVRRPGEPDSRQAGHLRWAASGSLLK